MAENSFRSYRNRDPVGRGDTDSAAARDMGGDPLVELARLIGQGDPNAELGRNARQTSPESFEEAGSGTLDWAANDGYAQQNQDQDYAAQNQGYAEQERVEDRYAPPPLAASYPSYATNQTFSPPEADYADEQQSADVRDDTRHHAEAPAVLRDRQAPPFASQSRDDGYETDDQQHEGAADQPYAPEDYYEEAPYRRRRSGSVVVVAVLGLAILGTAGAFAYRSMFGGSVLPTLPPIIKASDGPNKIVPAGGDSHAKAAGTANAAGASAEKLVPREEQPVDIQEPVKAPSPRVVSTIPVMPTQNSAAPSPVAAGAPAPPSAFGPPPPVANNAPPMPPAPAPAGALPEPKKIHTVTIRADQPASSAASMPPAPRPTASRSGASPRPLAAPPPGRNAPLSIVPQQEGEAAPPPAPRTRTAMARPTPLSPAAAGSEPAPAGGGYAVQVSSQRSEAEAQAAFHSLQARFPSQLAGRHPIVRRADLGAKGVYYRALVGPYASMEQAAGVCSSLKAAGGSCVVQRN
jgi:hypothetical protein